jgi:hypothetical protein
MTFPAGMWWSQTFPEGATVKAEGAAKPASQAAPSTELRVTETAETRPAIPAQQKEQLVTAIELLGVVLLLGLSLLAVTVLVGWRMRRALTQPLPPAPRGDELWFLKKKAAETGAEKKRRSGIDGD